MVAIILIVIGILMIGAGVIGLLGLVISPIIHDLKLVYTRKDDYVYYATETGKRLLTYHTRRLIVILCLCILMGSIMFGVGMYIGFADRGEDFFFYRKLFGVSAENQWDNINEKGQYVAADGSEYTYYILIQGENITFSGQTCADIDELKLKLTAMQRENKVILIDSFAVAEEYNETKKMLKTMGILFETETK